MTTDNLTINGTFTANGPSNIGTNNTTDAINIGTNGARTVAIGNAASKTTINGATITENAAGNLTLSSSAGTIDLNSGGRVSVENIAAATVSATTVANSARVGQVSYTGNTIVAGALQNFTVTGTPTTSASRMFAVAYTNSTPTPGLYALPVIQVITPGGTITFRIVNIGTVNIVPADTVFINYWILN